MITEGFLVELVKEYLRGMKNGSNKPEVRTSAGSNNRESAVFFNQSFIPASGNEFFVYWKQYYFIPSFFLLIENIIEIQGKSNFKDEPYYC